MIFFTYFNEINFLAYPEPQTRTNFNKIIFKLVLPKIDPTFSRPDLDTVLVHSANLGNRQDVIRHPAPNVLCASDTTT